MMLPVKKAKVGAGLLFLPVHWTLFSVLFFVGISVPLTGCTSSKFVDVEGTNDKMMVIIKRDGKLNTAIIDLSNKIKVNETITKSNKLLKDFKDQPVGTLLILGFTYGMYSLTALTTEDIQHEEVQDFHITDSRPIKDFLVEGEAFGYWPLAPVQRNTQGPHLKHVLPYAFTVKEEDLPDHLSQAHLADRIMVPSDPEGLASLGSVPAASSVYRIAARAYSAPRGEKKKRKRGRFIGHFDCWFLLSEDPNEIRLCPEKSMALNRFDDLPAAVNRAFEKIILWYFGPLLQPNNHVPPSLEATIRFSEPSGNNALDAEETAELHLDILNHGPGKAHFLIIKTSVDTPKIVALDPWLDAGSVAAGESLSTTLSVRAFRDISDGKLGITARIQEAYGFDAPPVAITLPTRRLRLPEFEIVDIHIQDQNHDQAIQPQERIRIRVRIANMGEGFSKNTKGEIILGKNIFSTSEFPFKFRLGDMAPNTERNIDFSFLTNNRLAAGQRIPVTLKISDDWLTSDPIYPIPLTMGESRHRQGPVVVIKPKSQADPRVDDPVSMTRGRDAHHVQDAN